MQIRAVMFDLGETLLNFGRVDTMRVFRQSAKQTYEYLMRNNQPAGKYWWYLIRNIAAIEVRTFWANITGRDFDALSLLKKFGVTEFEVLGKEFSPHTMECINVEAGKNDNIVTHVHEKGLLPVHIARKEIEKKLRPVRRIENQLERLS